ncbi:MAG: hypothetical protein ACPGWR_23290, partial [Ardenticatenaceae bacterium]
MFNPKPVEAVLEAVDAFIKAERWSESQEIVKHQRHLLLTDEADLVLANLLEQHADDPEMSKMLNEHRALLKRCRQEGIESAFADQTQTTNPVEVPPELMERLMAVGSEEELDELVEKHPELRSFLDELAAVAQQVLEEALAEDEDAPPVDLTPAQKQALANKLKVFISKDTLIDSERYLREHPELVTQEGLTVMGMLIERAKEAGDEEIVELFMDNQEILLDALDEKMDRELDDLLSLREEMTVLDLLEELMECDDPGDVLELVKEYPEVLSFQIERILGECMAHARMPGHVGGEFWADEVQAIQFTLREVRQLINQKALEQQNKEPSP